MKDKIIPILWISPLVLILDQWTKWLVVKNLAFGSKITILENFFDIVHVRNKGAAFGVLSTWNSEYRDLFFYVLALGAICFLFYFLKQLKKHEHKMVYPIALIVGGAIGNVADRAFRGSVVDFVSFHWYNESVHWEVWGRMIDFDLVWPAFNVADSAISVSVVYLIFCMMFQNDTSRDQPK